MGRETAKVGRAAGERLVLAGREVFVHCAAGYGGTVFSNNWVEKVP